MLASQKNHNTYCNGASKNWVSWFTLFAFLFIVSLACRSFASLTTPTSSAPVLVQSAPNSPGDYELIQGDENDQRLVLLHLPTDYKPDGQWPLLIILHGGGGDARQIARIIEIEDDADRAGFVIAFPNGSGPLEDKLFTWNSGHCCGYALQENVDDVGYLSHLIDSLIQDYAIDPERVYVAGISNGGMMAYRLAAEQSDKIAGAASISGTIGGQINPEGPLILPPVPQNPVRILAIHGRLDEHVLYEGGHGPKTTADRIDVSVSESMQFWAAANACADEMEEEVLAEAPLTFTRYSNCAQGGELLLVTIEDGGHAWPGAKKGLLADVPSEDLSANELIFEFFGQ